MKQKPHPPHSAVGFAPKSSFPPFHFRSDKVPATTEASILLIELPSQTSVNIPLYSSMLLPRKTFISLGLARRDVFLFLFANHVYCSKKTCFCSPISYYVAFLFFAKFNLLSVFQYISLIYLPLFPSHQGLISILASSSLLPFL